ncbi:UBX domain-containing protein 11-like [Gigantopelta aegis]|uniref:UBX domain-containing protein 11-like n=1 Tax=Gigantopelta aegis TaxID=1735272 RepID=UPI001B88DCB0|nr:UBX domain-containing protein 11-like [Gigantopelta aegis]
MSSPLSSLKKTHKLPLSGQRPIPFRDPHYTEDENKLLDEITTDMATSRIKERDPFLGGLPKLNVRHTSYNSTGSNSTAKNSVASSVPSDNELMSLMINRVSLLEQRLNYQSKEIAQKDKRIKVLEEKLQILQKARVSDSPSRTSDLEKKCLLLQQQVHEMESFLADYGMVWVGEQAACGADVYNTEKLGSDPDDEDAGMWRPGSSVSRTPDFHVDFDRIIENIKDLNTLAGDGVAKIKHTTDGARLKIPDPVPLTLYANGISLFSGPFRPFSDPATQQCVQDLLDGYFPSELQPRYPDGIPFAVTDRRMVSFRRKSLSIFTGTGQALGGETKPSRLVPSNLDITTQTFIQPDMSGTLSSENSGSSVTSRLSGPQMSVEQFLEKLPKSILKQGRLIDIRDSIADNLKGSPMKSSSVTVIETEVTADMKKRLEDKEENARPSTPRNITTLRIKSESGDHTYIVKMKFIETIGDLRKYLDKARKNMPAYKITTAYPKKTYDDDSATLEESGLTPNAVMLLRPVT